MANTLGPSGLTINSLTDIINLLTLAMQNIYGVDINVDSNSPDGQLINVFAQAAEDQLELIDDVYNSFGVQTAYGQVLDQRVALNGMARNQGTYTQTYVLVTVNQALTLYGLDQTAQTPFTVSDNAGNQYSLAETTAFAGAASRSLLFQAVDIGETQVTANTIANQVNSVLGVVSVNNPATSILVAGNTTNASPTVTSISSTSGMVPGLLISGVGIPLNTFISSVDSTTQVTMTQNATADGSSVSVTVSTPPTITGVNEETDSQLKTRQVQMFALASVGPADAVQAALLSNADITDALVVENATSSPVGGVPANSIWCIVAGGTDAEIAQAIYAKKGLGCGQFGSHSSTLTRPNGLAFVAKWDVAISQPLFIQFSINPRTPGQSFDTALLATQLAAELVYKLGQNPTVGDVVNAMLTLAPSAYLTDIGVSSDGVSFFDVVTPTTPQYYYALSSANIVISQ